MLNMVSQRLILRLIVDWCCPRSLEAIAPDRSHRTPSRDARVSTSTTMDLSKNRINSDYPTSSLCPLGWRLLVNAKSASSPDQNLARSWSGGRLGPLLIRPVGRGSRARAGWLGALALASPGPGRTARSGFGVPLAVVGRLIFFPMES